MCINQDDIPERTQQVRMMGDIYAAVSTAVIWLGEEADEVKMAFGCNLSLLLSAFIME